MSAKRGGKKRPYKKKGRVSARKQYQMYCREQQKSGKVPSASGQWSNDTILSQKIREVYAAQTGIVG